MMNLIKGDNPKLKKMCEKVGRRQGIKVGRRLNKFFQTVPHAYGLAAPQVGMLHRVFIIRFEGVTTIVINPEILKYGHKKIKMEEACLSHSWTRERGINMKRSFEIDVFYYNGKGETVSETLTDMKARIFQHEVDHLNGICIVDK
jgi:peptide deformylase